MVIFFFFFKFFFIFKAGDLLCFAILKQLLCHLQGRNFMAHLERMLSDQ